MQDYLKDNVIETEVEGQRGLKGLTVGETKIVTVGKDGTGLMYRGYSVEDLVDFCEYEEVAYLLVNGKLPTKPQLTEFKKRIEAYRCIDSGMQLILEALPLDTHPMDVLRTSVSFLGTIHKESKTFGLEDVLILLLATHASCLSYHYFYHTKGVRIDTRGKPGDSVARHFLRLVNQKEPHQEQVESINKGLILMAEHGFATSTFNARICASTLSDVYSSVTSGIATMRGPLHGGASEQCMYMIRDYMDIKDALHGTRKKFENKEVIPGFGHRIYKRNDPRAVGFRACAQRLCCQTSYGERSLFERADAIAKLMWEEKKLIANMDFYAAPMYHSCGIPVQMFPVVMVVARTAGWLANIGEQRERNKIIRPLATYVGEYNREFTPLRSRM